MMPSPTPVPHRSPVGHRIDLFRSTRRTEAAPAPFIASDPESRILVVLRADGADVRFDIDEEWLELLRTEYRDTGRSVTFDLDVLQKRFVDAHWGACAAVFVHGGDSSMASRASVVLVSPRDLCEVHHRGEPIRGWVRISPEGEPICLASVREQSALVATHELLAQLAKVAPGPRVPDFGL